MITTADIRDHAEATEAVAAIGDLDVGDSALDGTLDLRNIGGNLALNTQHVIDDRDDAVFLVGLHKGRDLGKLVGKVVAVA